jgi:dihydroxyacetone kinase-like predicted kinase
VDGLHVAEGEYLGLVDERAVVSRAELGAAVLDVAERLVPGAGIMTVLIGADAPPPDELVLFLVEHHPSLEVEVHEGGQQHYLYLLAAE